MKKRPVIWAPAARGDLFHILQYVVSHNPTAADRIGERIQAAAASLGEAATGRIGRVAHTFEKVVRGLPYIIAYEIVVVPPTAEELTILRVIHGARDWSDEHWPID